MGLRPSYVPHPPDPVAMLERCDAALLIGDAALKVRLDEYETWILRKSGWNGSRSLLCVLSGPAGPDARLPEDLISIFQEAKEWGLRRRDGNCIRVFARSSIFQ